MSEHQQQEFGRKGGLTRNRNTNRKEHEHASSSPSPGSLASLRTRPPPPPSPVGALGNGRVVRDEVRVAVTDIAARFSDDAPAFSSYEPVLRKRYVALAAWPADAELGLYLLAWLLGPGFSVRGFSQAVNQFFPNFEAAARSLPEGKSSDITVYAIARRAFRNAAVVVRWDLEPELLYWPLELSACWGSGSCL